MSLDDYLDIGGTTRVKVAPPDPGNPPKSNMDAYPRIVLDQRDIYGKAFRTADEVFAFWAEFLATRKRTPQSLFRDEEGRHVSPRVEYDASTGVSKWVAVCPACGGGMALWDRNPYAACLDCGRVYEIDWHTPDDRAEALRLLAERPKEYRVWVEGETVDDLRVQNETIAQFVGPRPKLVIPDEVVSDDELLDEIDRRV